MSLYVPTGADFRSRFSSHATVRPANNFGTNCSPGNNTFSTYVSILSGASVTEDCYGILININGASGSGVAIPCVVNIGIDPAGGTGFSDWLTNLNCGNAGNYGGGAGAGGSWYYFPMFIKAGTSIGASGRATQAGIPAYVNITLFGRPARPETVRAASKFQDIGISGSVGTAVTLGTTSEGAWTSLGTTSRDLWWWQIGVNCNDSTMTAASIHLDLAAGDASNKRILIENQFVTTLSVEQIHNSPLTIGCTGYVKSGETIYGRAQSSTTTDSGFALSAYGCG